MKILAELEGDNAVAVLCWPCVGPCAPTSRTHEHDTRAGVEDQPTATYAEPLQEPEQVIPATQPLEQVQDLSAHASPAYIVSAHAPARSSPAQPSPVHAAPPTCPPPAQLSPAQPSPAQLSPAQPSPAQPSPAQPSPVQPSPLQSLPTGSYPQHKNTSLPHPVPSTPAKYHFQSSPLSPPPSQLDPHLPDSEAALRAIKEARWAHLEEELVWVQQAIKNRKDHLKLMKRMKKSKF